MRVNINVYYWYAWTAFDAHKKKVIYVFLNWTGDNIHRKRGHKGLRRRARVIRAFPGEGSLLRIAGCILMNINEVWTSFCNTVIER